MVDTTDLKSVARKSVPVQVRPRAPALLFLSTAPQGAYFSIVRYIMKKVIVFVLVVLIVLFCFMRTAS